jgi:hypothetical protein
LVQDATSLWGGGGVGAVEIAKKKIIIQETRQKETTERSNKVEMWFQAVQANEALNFTTTEPQ